MTAYPDSERSALLSRYDDIWLVDGRRTPFADYCGELRDISPTDLGIYAARALFEESGVPATDVDAVIAGNVAQASFDAYLLPRHIGLYAGVRQSVPALLVHRLCGTGFEAILTAADQIKLGKAQLVLCAGAESMSRNPVASYTHRAGFRMGQVDFRDFLWEATIDTAPDCSMGGTAENLAQRYGINREEADEFAARSFACAEMAWETGYFDGEVVPVENTTWSLDGYNDRGLKLADRVQRFDRDGHVRHSPIEVLSKLRPAFGGVQTGGNSSGIVDGAGAVLVASGDYVRAHGLRPLARIVGGSVVGVPPEIMGIGPAPAIGSLLADLSMALNDISRFEINEAFSAQYIACERELGLDRDRVNVHGGSIAFGHPLAVSGVRLTHTVARQLQQSGEQFGISSACAGGGQGVAVLLENAG
ncbi:thiolase family protein [Saccharospirillum salsuginis]|uniref:Acetyl-CoA acetyltransferase n=1 Tax=Saccharospirillum salsuginis TaxID=418750 RepID=A0A918KQK5_9GAMM|nr:thiolase family protein [Saccharospirillum salsuginis]GGX72083.1 acetyl-CoA acetyltransferase [Saccharospirillum salsuginis]